jgi:hypothetical protein
MCKPIWTFHASITETRRRQLINLCSFENIVGGLILCAEMLAFRPAKGQIVELSGCTRAEFLLKVPPFLYDAFFNSPVGYRAQYALDVSRGERKNRELIDALRAKLLACTSGQADFVRIESSIDASQAKIWIDEDEVQNHYLDDSPEIDFPRWLENSEGGAGPRAPLGSRLVVCGGWIDQSGAQRLNPYKQMRSRQIHDAGFS